jgi:hypothetical protein
MSKNKAEQLSSKQMRYVALAAQGTMTDTAIGQAVGVGRATVTRWKLDPVIVAAVEVERERVLAAIRRKGIRDRENRLAAYDDRWNLLQRVIKERGDEPDMRDVPGGATGMLVRHYKLSGGKEAQEREEYEVDTGLLSAMLALEKQAAQEAGQWVERTKVLGQHLDLSTMTDEQLQRLASGEDPLTVLLGSGGSAASG